MSFVRPAELPAIPTYRIMDSDGQIVDATHAPDVKDEEVVEWYINMLTGLPRPSASPCLSRVYDMYPLD